VSNTPYLKFRIGPQLFLSSVVNAAPTPIQRRQQACFVVGNTALPAEIVTGVADLASELTPARTHVSWSDEGHFC